MELTDPNYHLKLIEMCDCYLDTDYPAQLRSMVNAPSTDLDEDAIKYLALAILSAITEKAGKLSLKRKKERLSATLSLEEEKISLPTPARPLFDRIFDVMKGILRSEEEKIVMPLSLGLKNNQLEVQVKLECKKDKESLKLKFPRL